MSTSTSIEPTGEPTTAAGSSIRSIPLADFHRQLGARLSPYRGVEAPADYGELSTEHAALRQGCGLVDRSWLERIEMRGTDRARFLGGLVTCDVKSLEPGSGTYGFITNVKGRILADVAVLALDDRLVIELSPSTSAEVIEHLRKYVIFDQVEIAPLADALPLGLVGPRAAEVLAVENLPATAYSHRPVSLHGVDVLVVKEPSLGESTVGEITAWTLWAPVADACGLFETLVEGGAAHGLKPVGHRALDSLRVEAGRPLYGVDFDAANFPQESGLEDQAVSYSKGCYLGQEVVARIHYRGGVNRHLRRLVFDEHARGSGDVNGLVGRSLQVGGRDVGKVTSVAESESGPRIGLAILHQRAEPDAEVEIDGGGTARVVELALKR